MTSKALSDYLALIPSDRVESFRKLYQTIQDNLPEGFETIIQSGMIQFVVPHSIYPAGYHCQPTQPLPFVSLANQKQGIHLYHMGLYSQPDLLEWFVREFPKHSNRKLGMGKSCVRFRGGKDIPYELIGELMTKLSVADYVANYEKQRAQT